MQFTNIDEKNYFPCIAYRFLVKPLPTLNHGLLKKEYSL